MITTTTCRGGTVIVHVTGEVDMANVGQLDHQLARLSSTNTIVDLEGTEFLAVSGVRVLLNAARRAHALSHVLAVAAPTHAAARVLWLTAADAELTVFTSMAEAVHALP